MEQPTLEQIETDAKVKRIAEADEVPRVVIHMPVDIRSVSMAVIAVLASVFALRWASAVFIPVMVGLLFSYALSPVVGWLHKRHVPRALSAGVLILAIVGSMVGIIFSLSDDASRLIESIPLAAQKLRESAHGMRSADTNALAKVQKAATQLEQAAEEAATPAPPVTRGVQRVVLEKPKFDIKDHIWTGTLGLAAGLGQAAVVALITFFLLASGDTFRRKVVKMAGPTLGKKRVTLEALNEIHEQIQRYMLVNLLTALIVGVATWVTFMAIGLKHAAVWGIAAGILNLVPYLGAALITGGSALIAFLQFGSLEAGLLVGALSSLINGVEGFLLTPWLTSRANRMNPVAIFIGVLAFGWLWGAWGLLLGVPVLVIVKAICDRVDDLKPVGEILGT